jgi:hypothetical protein
VTSSSRDDQLRSTDYFISTLHVRCDTDLMSRVTENQFILTIIFRNITGLVITSNFIYPCQQLTVAAVLTSY